MDRECDAPTGQEGVAGFGKEEGKTPIVREERLWGQHQPSCSYQREGNPAKEGLCITDSFPHSPANAFVVVVQSAAQPCSSGEA